MGLGQGGFTLGFAMACLALSIFLASSGRAEPVAVGDIKVDPQDFAADKDPQTRIAACLACHGNNAGGDADFGPEVQFGTPALRGMAESYLKQSLIDYKTGRRPHEEMQVIASLLDDETIDFMAKRFAAYPAAALKPADELARLAQSDDLFAAGQAIALVGLPDKEIPACRDCHGERGEGLEDLGPHLAGQNALYVQQQFAAYAKEERATEQAGIMQPIAAALSEAEVAAVAHYYEQLVQIDKP